MNEADRLFARIAINKSYVIPAHVEEARSYLQKLRGSPGGSSLPLSLGSILAKLGRLSQVQVAAVQKDMEPFGFNCVACGKRSFFLEHGETERRCGPCRESNAPPRAEAEQKPASETKRVASSRTSILGGAGGDTGKSELTTRKRALGPAPSAETPRAGGLAASGKIGSSSPFEATKRVQAKPMDASKAGPKPAPLQAKAAPKPAPAAKPAAPKPPPPDGATVSLPEEELAHSRGGSVSAFAKAQSGSEATISEGPTHEEFKAAATEMVARDAKLVIGAREFGETTGKSVEQTRPVKAAESPTPKPRPMGSSATARYTKPGGGTKGGSKAAAAPQAPDPYIGKTIGGCRIEQFLGRGGMGTVYKAVQVDLDRVVAFKVLSPALTADPKQVAQFLREAKALAKLEHNNIVSIYNAAKEEDCHFIVMQFVAGGGLDGVIKRDGPRLPLNRVVKFIEQAARGLAEAHLKGITHRDIKPENMLVADGDVLKVTDFGLARMDQDAAGFTFAEGRIVGTPYYMSPEQIDGRNVDNRTDIYALGATFYYMLTGQKPFEGDTPVEILLKHVNEPLVSPSRRQKEVPENLSRIVEKAMAKKPEERYASIRDFLRDLENAQKGQEVKVDLPKADEKKGDSLFSDAPGAPIPGLAPLTGAPVVIERPRSFYYAAGGLAVASVLALALGIGPLQAIMEDASAEQVSPRELDAQREWHSMEGAVPKGKAGVERLRRFAEDYKETKLALDAMKQADDLNADVLKEAQLKVAELVTDAREKRAAGRFAAAFSALRSFPKEMEGFGVEKALEPEIAATRDELAQKRNQAYVPPGVFIYGDKDSEGRKDLPAFYIDLTEVSNRDYAAVVKEGKPAPVHWLQGAPKPGTEDHPVTGVSARDADAFARAKGKRLPSPLEWEKAARGTEGKRFPWGDQVDFALANHREGGARRLEAVTARPKGASPYGCLNMAGNAAEWTIAPLDPPGPDGAREVVWVKGGAFDDDLIMCRAAFWNAGLGKDDAHPAVGFRCVQDVEK